MKKQIYSSPSGYDSGFYRKKRAVEGRIGRELSADEFESKYYIGGGNPQ